MTKLLYSVMLFAFTISLGPSVWAEDSNTGKDDAAMTTTAGAKEVTRGLLKDELVGVKPQAGILAFTEPATGNGTSRGAVGLAIDMNAASFIAKDLKNLYLGPSTGVIYSHLGSPTSNFFGANPSNNTGSAGANLLIIPTDLKVGYTFGDNYRVSAHGGGNLIYRSVASSLNLGSSSAQSGSVWRIFPNVGADFEAGLGKNALVLLRPDVTITPGDSFFTGTVALGVLLG